MDEKSSPPLAGSGLSDERLALSNPMFSLEDRLEMALGAIKFRNDVIANLRTRLTESSPPDAARAPTAEHACWLIETTATPTPLYFAGDSLEWRELDGQKLKLRAMEQFVPDANAAIRFPTKKSAEGFLALQMRLQRTGAAEAALAVLRMGLSCYRVAEHIFDYTPRDAARVVPEIPLANKTEVAKPEIRGEARDAALAALIELVAVIEAAGLQNLTNGVQLGPTVWYVKAYYAMNAARAAIDAALTGKPA